MIEMLVKNWQAFQRDIGAANRRRVKAAEIATKVEGYRLMRILKKEIRAGAPGGRALAPLSEIAKRRGRGGNRRRNRSPLARLAFPVRYNTETRGGTFTFRLGFVNPNRGRPISKSWKRIAQAQQQGGSLTLSEEGRKGLIRMGASLKRRSTTEDAARYFFLKKSTRNLRLPARPILDPFWNTHEGEVRRNLERNFARKMAGERI